MKPKFALSLSVDGIQLLHRAAGGWLEVGKVDIGAENLKAELGKLRRIARGMAPRGLKTKLIIPRDQIRYMTIDTPGMTRPERVEAALAALEGATPYAVKDLSFDICPSGPVTHIAAVANETLLEAETFASEHLFDPVSFVAIPGDEPFMGEPFFGPTLAARSQIEQGEIKVEPDGIAVVVVGTVPEEVKEEALERLRQQAQAAAAPKPEKAEDDAAEAAPVAPRAIPPAPEEAPADPVRAADVTDPGLPPAEPEPPRAAPDESPSGFASRRAAPPVRTEPVITAPAPTIETPLRPDSSSLDHPAPEPEPEPEPQAAPLVAPARTPAEPAKVGFLSRRKPGQGAAALARAQAASEMGRTPEPRSEVERMTIFGARGDAEIGGKPRFLGLILTAALLVFLAGVAAWAAVFLDEGVAGLWGGSKSRAVASAPEFQIEPKIIRAAPEADPEPDPEPLRTAALDPDLTLEDSAVLDALSEPAPAQIPPPEMTREEAEARYAVTGIWPLPPGVPEPPATISLDDFYLTSIDPVSTASDAIALPPVRSFATDTELPAVASPAAPGTNFALDARGMVIPTPEGAVSPDGVVVYAGRPPLVPPDAPTRFSAEPAPDAERPALAGFRPRERPGNLVETNERATLGGLSRSELADYRPEMRPQSIQQAAEEAEKTRAAVAAAAQAAAAAVEDPNAVPPEAAPATPFDGATKFAVVASVRPDTRPRNFERIVKRAERQPAEEPQVTQAATIAPLTVQPKIPSSASVSKQATVQNAINLRKVNLIGVYGKPSSRRALVRLGNGRYQKVVVGDRIDGGRVSAIGDSELRYTKGGRAVVLKMPKS